MRSPVLRPLLVVAAVTSLAGCSADQTSPLLVGVPRDIQDFLVKSGLPPAAGLRATAV
jgi:hypothetical protein